MRPHIHVTLDQAENGWVMAIMRHDPISGEQNPQLMVAPTLQDACKLLIAEMSEQRPVRRSPRQMMQEPTQGGSEWLA